MRDERLERLDDYVRGHAHDDDASYEEELFARALDGNADELVALDSLTASLRGHAVRHTLPNFTDAAGYERLRQELGDRLAFSSPAGHSPVTEATALLVIKVPVDLSDVDRVDVESIVVGVGSVKTMPDVLFEKGGDALYLCCEPALAARADAAVGAVITRCWGHKAGEKRLLAEVNWATVT